MLIKALMILVLFSISPFEVHLYDSGVFVDANVEFDETNISWQVIISQNRTEQTPFSSVIGTLYTSVLGYDLFFETWGESEEPNYTFSRLGNITIDSVIDWFKLYVQVNLRGGEQIVFQEVKDLMNQSSSEELTENSTQGPSLVSTQNNLTTPFLSVVTFCGAGILLFALAVLVYFWRLR